MQKKNINEKIAVLTSGGDSPGMNATIRSIVLTSQKKNYEIYGIQDGFLGLYQNKIKILEKKNLPPRILNVSGTFLGTSRFLDFKTNENIPEKCFQNLKKKNINKVIIIGGDGSYKGAWFLNKFGLKCVGIPATIDNDINFTDFTIGFSTAVNNITNAIENLRDTSISHRRCTIIEVMGRDKGDLALFGGIAKGADLIITRENFIEKKEILEKIKFLFDSNQRHAIVIITENILNIFDLAKEVEKYSGFETKAQVLGYIQRGGRPTAEDLVLATRMGNYALHLLEKNIYNGGVSFFEGKLRFFKFKEIFSKEKIIQKELINLISEI